MPSSTRARSYTHRCLVSVPISIVSFCGEDGTVGEYLHKLAEAGGGAFRYVGMGTAPAGGDETVSGDAEALQVRRDLCVPISTL